MSEGERVGGHGRALTQASTRFATISSCVPRARILFDFGSHGLDGHDGFAPGSTLPSQARFDWRPQDPPSGSTTDATSAFRRVLIRRLLMIQAFFLAANRDVSSGLAVGESTRSIDVVASAESMTSIMGRRRAAGPPVE